MIEQAMITLLGNAPFSAAFRNADNTIRLTPKRIAANSPLPALSYQVISGLPPTLSQTGESGPSTIRYQITVWTKGYLQAVQRAAEIAAYLHGWKGVLNGVNIQQIRMDNQPFDLTDQATGLDQRIMDFMITTNKVV